MTSKNNRKKEGKRSTRQALQLTSSITSTVLIEFVLHVVNWLHTFNSSNNDDLGLTGSRTFQALADTPPIASGTMTSSTSLPPHFGLIQWRCLTTLYILLCCAADIIAGQNVVDVHGDNSPRHIESCVLTLPLREPGTLGPVSCQAPVEIRTSQRLHC